MKGTLRARADQIRDQVIEVAVRNRAGHIAPSLSCVDILVALYFKAMRYQPENPVWEDRDRLILSKGHGPYALYAILADLGVIPRAQWEGYYTEGSRLGGCIERNLSFGLEAGTGSLGHGLPMAVGLAFAAKVRGRTYHTFCVTGDGEFQEGSMWEALSFAVKHRLDNLTVIVDRNGLQAMDHTTKILERDEGDLARRLAGFGAHVLEAGGHQTDSLGDLFCRLRSRSDGSVVVVLARTVKGYGLKCMENVPKFHFRLPEPVELAQGRSYGGSR